MLELERLGRRDALTYLLPCALPVLTKGAEALNARGLSRAGLSESTAPVWPLELEQD